jgi:PBP1b-binding outer membrane lipoprotein LpoB
MMNRKMWIFFILLLTGCSNRKAAIVDNLRIAKNHVDHAKKRMEDIQFMQQTEIDLAGTSHAVKITPMDSIIKWTSQAIGEKEDWQPVVDSLELELKKY